MKKILVVALVVAIALIGVTAAFANNHTAMSCRTCHTPHGGGSVEPLWDVTAGAARITASTIAQANSAPSDLCIACHDGTYAGVTWARAEAKVFADGGVNDHPINAVGGNYGTQNVAVNALYINASGVFTNDATGDGLVECQSCHYVHNDATKSGANYVRVVAAGTAFCNACHVSW